MSSISNIEVAEVRKVVEGLLGRDIHLEKSEVAPHVATLRGLVTDKNDLIGAIGSDLPFAHYSGAALALIPVGGARDAGDSPSAELLENYREVANVLSRVANEATPPRVRIDPGMVHEDGSLMSLVSTSPSVGYRVEISGYGGGCVGIWIND